jgi:phosphatidylserine/phosphatidylglycerophosphate/cardiolipin synthase-like enzyme
MFKTVNAPLHKELLHHCSSARNSILLCAPFVKQDIICDVVSSKLSRVKIKLVTRISLESFHRKASDSQALRTVIANNGEVYNVSNLHAKIFIFDNAECYITSANLTSSGLEHNYEYGIYSDDRTFVNSVVSDFNQLLSDTQTGIIKTKNINEIDEILQSIPSLPRTHYPSLRLNLAGNISPITANLHGWKLAVFNALDSLDITEFDASVSNQIAEQLGILYPSNANREAKVRQVLQQLRDIGLIQFVSPGNYAKLWE